MNQSINHIAETCQNDAGQQEGERRDRGGNVREVGSADDRLPGFRPKRSSHSQGARDMIVPCQSSDPQLAQTHVIYIVYDVQKIY